MTLIYPLNSPAKVAIHLSESSHCHRIVTPLTQFRTILIKPPLFEPLPRTSFVQHMATRFRFPTPSVLRLAPVLSLCFLMCQMNSIAQEAPWWKQLFRAKPQAETVATTPGGIPPTSTTETQDFPDLFEVNTPLQTNEAHEASDNEVTSWEEGLLLREHDSQLDSLDSLWHLTLHPLKGYRVQLFLGPLHEARAIRAKYRRIDPELSVYLISAAPSFRVAIGNFRSRWEAEREREAWATRFPHALVVPMAIELPPLTIKEATTE